MPAPAELQNVPAGSLVAPGRALPSLPARQGLWVGTQVVAAAALGLSGLWASHPEVAVSAALGMGASAIDPRRLWAIPAGTAAVVLAGAFTSWLTLPAIIGAGFAAGAVGTALLPHETDARDMLNGALATLTGACLGLWAATTLLPAAMPVALFAMLTSGIVGLVASQGLLPATLRFDNGPELPTVATIRRTLELRYRAPVQQALQLYRSCRGHAPDTDTKRGLAEVAVWVYRLQLTRQTLETEAEAIDPVRIQARIDAAIDPETDSDSFTRERKLATAEHLRRLLTHGQQIRTEAQRTIALVDYALAFLEEARAGLVIARKLPGENGPERLGEVLSRLRTHADEGQARRSVSHEVDH